jgi:hypothetical protein
MIFHSRSDCTSVVEDADAGVLTFLISCSSQKKPTKEEILKEHALEHNASFDEHTAKNLTIHATTGRTGIAGVSM